MPDPCHMQVFVCARDPYTERIIAYTHGICWLTSKYGKHHSIYYDRISTLIDKKCILNEFLSRSIFGEKKMSRQGHSLALD